MNDEHKDITKLIYHDDIGRVQLVQHWGTDQTIVDSARVSFGQHNKTGIMSERDEKLIKYLINFKLINSNILINFRLYGRNKNT